MLKRLVKVLIFIVGSCTFFVIWLYHRGTFDFIMPSQPWLAKAEVAIAALVWVGILSVPIRNLWRKYRPKDAGK